MKKYILFVLFSLIALCVNAQKVEVEVSSENVAEGEVFKLTYLSNSGQIRDVKLGNMPDGVSIEGGPFYSSSSSFSMVNGHMSSEVHTSVTYYVASIKKGDITIPPAQVVVGGKTVKSPSVKVKVGGGGSRQSTPQQNPNSTQQQGNSNTDDASSRVSEKNLFIKAEVDKTTVHEQEAILLTYKIYTKLNVEKYSNAMPDMKGFHVQEVPRQGEVKCHSENGYSVGILNQYVIYPQQSGKLEIPPTTYNLLVGPDPNDISSFFQPQRRVTAQSKLITVDVKPLPEKPTEFSGGVGEFSITAQVDHTKVKAGDPITLRVIVDGTGNLKLIQAPELKLPKDFDKYDPKTTDNTSSTKDGLEGNIIFDYVIVPRKQGKYTLPPVEMSYFDSETGKYKTIKSQPISLDILEGDGNSSVADFSGNADETDIRGIMSGDTSLRKEGETFFGSVAYFMWLIIPLIIFVVLFVVFRKNAIDKANIVKMKGKKANKVATRRLQNAANLMHQNRQNEFYDEVLRALWGYVGDKLNIEAVLLSKDNIADNLTEKGIDENTINVFIQAIDDCEYARYAPGDPKGKMDHVYESAMMAITDIDNMLNNKTKTAAKSAAMPVVMLFAMLMLGMNASAAVTKWQADDLFSKGKYQEAIDGYNEILKTGVSADVYYNLGNAYFRTNNITQAIIAYERAYRLAPGNSDIKYNLTVAQQKTIDKVIPENEMFFVTWYHNIINFTSADNWAVISIVCVIMLLISLVLYLFVQDMRVIKGSFTLASCSLVLFVLSTLFAVLQRVEFSSKEGAVIINSSVEVKQTPDEKAAETMILHEGTYVEITDKNMKEWLGIRTADGREGWLRPKQIEKI